MKRSLTSAKVTGIWPWETSEMSVSITIYDVPKSLVREFAEKVIRPMYPGGVSDAIKDLIRKAVQEQREKTTSTHRGESSVKVAQKRESEESL